MVEISESYPDYCFFFREQIPVEMMGKNPLDMSQYKKIFGTCRIPGERRDKLSFNDSKYVTVIHNNHVRIYFINVLILRINTYFIK